MRGAEVGFDDTFPDEDDLDDPILNKMNQFDISTFEVKSVRVAQSGLDVFVCLFACLRVSMGS